MLFLWPEFWYNDAEVDMEHFQETAGNQENWIKNRMEKIKNDATGHDLALMDELEEFAQSLAIKRKKAGLGPLPDNIRELAYEEREAVLH